MAGRRLEWAVVCAVVFAFVATGAEAQRSIALVAGPTFSKVESEDFPDSETSTGFFAGIGTSFALTDVLVFDPYVAYVQKGAEFGSEKVSYDYIEVPLLLGAVLPIGENASAKISVGPQIAFQINCEEPESIEGGDCTEFENHKSTEFGVVAAAGVGFGLSEGMTLAVGAGADFGLTDIYENLDYKTRTYMAYVAFVRELGR